MSLPIAATSTDQTLKFEAYLSDGTVKPDLVAADVDTLIVDRDQLADVTIYNETGPVGAVSDKASPTTTHADGAIRGLGNGRYSVDAPDSAFASVTTCQIRGTWTDGGDSGYFVGEITPVVGYDPTAAAVGASTLTAQQVWEYGTRTLSSFGSLVSDVATAVWAAGTRTLTAFGFTVTTDTDSRNASKADVSALATAAKLLNYVRLLARKDPEVRADLSTEVAEINADTGTGAGSYDNETDSGEAIRDRGDAAWVSGGGGSASVVVTPINAIMQTNEPIGSRIESYYLAAKSIAFTVTDSEGTAIDLSSIDLEFRVENNAQSRTEVFTITSEDIAIGGDSSNVATVTVAASNHDEVGEFIYSLRDTSTAGTVYASGAYDVRYAPVGG